MRVSTFLYSSVIAFFLGVAVRSLISFDVATLLFFLLLWGVLFMYWSLSRSQAVLLGTFILLLFAIGAGRVAYAEHQVDTNRTLFEQTTSGKTVEGVVVTEAVEKETTRQFYIETEETKIVVIANRFPEVQYGDKVVLTGEVVLPESFETETGRIFDYPAYLSARGVTHQMFRPEIEIVGADGGSFIKRKLFVLKELFLDRVRSVVPEPHVSLLGGLVVGAQEAMGDNLLEAFRITGIIHIVVLSGYNVTIVAESIMRALGSLSRRWQATAGVISIVLFAIITGATATIVRASIMALLVILARVTGRTYEIVRALLVTAFIMVLYNPYVLLFDPSFQLSFLATLGLIFLVPLLERLFKWMDRVPIARSFILATLATQIFVLPLLLYQVGMVSTVSIPVNVLILPVVPLVMLLGFITGVVGFLNTLVSIPFGFVSYLILEYILRIVSWFAELPFAALRVPEIGAWSVVAVYMLYAAVLYVLARKTKQPRDVVEAV